MVVNTSVQPTAGNQRGGFEGGGAFLVASGYNFRLLPPRLALLLRALIQLALLTRRRARPPATRTAHGELFTDDDAKRRPSPVATAPPRR